MKSEKKKNRSNAAKQKNFPGYPPYPSDEDIYNNEKEEPYKNREEQEREAEGTEGTPLDENLDVPGADLDDADEIIGEEDEENNYYSLGGDNHENLEEDHPDQ